MLLRFVNRRFCREALGTSATLYTVCSHCDIAGITRGIGLSTSPFRRCSFTPHPPIRLRTKFKFKFIQVLELEFAVLC